MPASTKNYNANQIILGPSDIWLDVAVPTSGQRLTLTSGTPDDATSGSAVHLGMTAAGVTFEYVPEIQDFTSDELTAPHMSRIISESCTIKGEFLQVFNWNLLQKMTVGGTRNVSTATAGPYEELTMGGLSTVSTYSIALIGQDISGSSEYWVIQLYKTYNKAGFNFAVTRKDQSKAAFEFMGLAVTGRAIGDQIANFWHMGAANS
jgi:hypothetical protein